MYAQVCFPVAFPTNHHPLTPHGHANPAANHIPSHPNARTKHQSSPPALLDGTGLLQMPLQRAESPETMQDNWSNWDHMRHTRSHKRQHEPNETPRHSATHTHLRGNSSAPLTAQDPPISLPQASATIGVHFRPTPKARSLRAEGRTYTYLLRVLHVPSYPRTTSILGTLSGP